MSTFTITFSWWVLPWAITAVAAIFYFLLTWTALTVAALAVALPLSPLATRLGFVALPAMYYVFLALATATYLGLVELVKRIALRRALA